MVYLCSESSTTSLASSVKHYQYENGRYVRDWTVAVAVAVIGIVD